jgi:hypothetical protein
MPLNFSNDLIIPEAMALRSTKLLTEMAARNFPGGEERQERKTDSFAPSVI